MLLDEVKLAVESFSRKNIPDFWTENTFLIILKPCSTNVLLLYPLKASENRGFSDVFRGYRSRTLVENGLT